MASSRSQDRVATSPQSETLKLPGLNDLIADLRRIGIFSEATEATGLSLTEIADGLKMSREGARRKVVSAIKDGTMEYAGKSPRPTITGGTAIVPVYCPVHREP